LVRKKKSNRPKNEACREDSKQLIMLREAENLSSTPVPAQGENKEILTERGTT